MGRRLQILLLCMAPVLSGCFENYWQNRRRDLHEAFLYDAQVGLGLNADFRVGPIAWGFGLGSKSLAAYGKVNWWTQPTGFEVINIPALGGMLLALTSQLPDMPGRLALAFSSQTILKEVTDPNSSLAGLAYDRLSVLGVGNLVQLGRQDRGDDPRDAMIVDASAPKTSPEPIARTPVRRAGLSTRHKIIDQFGIEVGAFGGLVGTRVGFNPLEFTDFLLGWMGLDLLFDDG